MRRVRRANYGMPQRRRRKIKLTRKVLEARMQDLLNEPTPLDDERMQQIIDRAYEEYMRREQSKTPDFWLLDGESRKKEVAKQLAEWDNE